ncbi:MAG: nucleoside phosphorylase, partial [Clostridiales bacterium]|nr:nucleoside phosphorylase [Clostridiales bacterium]
MIKKEKYPILEFDGNEKGMIEPSETVAPIDISEYCVITYFRDAIEKYIAQGAVTKIATYNCETIEIPIYETIINTKRICLVQGYVGAPGAVGVLEKLIALGVRKFIVCGGAGVLQKDLTLGHLIIPTSAIRDEGTSYHYAKPSREIGADSGVLSIIENELES